MNFTKRQLVLLTTALTLFYDEIAKTSTAKTSTAKTSTAKMKAEVMEIAEMVQGAYEEAE